MLTFLFLCAMGLAFAALIAIPGPAVRAVLLGHHSSVPPFLRPLFRSSVLFGLIFGIFRFVFGIIGGILGFVLAPIGLLVLGASADRRRRRWDCCPCWRPSCRLRCSVAGVGDLPDRVAASHPDILIISAACREHVSSLPSYFSSWLFVPVGAHSNSRRHIES